jgi:hypothetical protein
MFESALVNSWVLYKATGQKLDLHFTHLEFRRAIALELTAKWEDLGCVNRAVGKALSSETELLKFPAKMAKKVFLVLDEPADKLTQADQHAQALEKIPCMEGAKIQHWHQLLCMHCKNPEQLFGADCVQNFSVAILASFFIILNQMGSKQISKESGFTPFFMIISYEMLLVQATFFAQNYDKTKLFKRILAILKYLITF